METTIRVPLKLSLRQRDLIRHHTSYGAEFASGVLPNSRGISIALTAEQIRDMLAHLTAEIHKFENIRREMEMDRICQKLEQCLDEFV